MEQPASNAPTTKVIAILESLPSSKGKPKGPRCVLTDQYLYIDGPAYFQDHRGKWKRVNNSGAIDLKDITSVSYERQADVFGANQRFLAAILIGIILGILVIAISVICLAAFSSGHSYDDSKVDRIILSGLVGLILAPPIVSIAIGIWGALQSMICIGMGCEAILLKAAWYPQVETARFYDCLLQAVSEAHRTEEISVDADATKTFRGESILAEFGESYRKLYEESQKTQCGFCSLTPERLCIGGPYFNKSLIWLKSRKMQYIHLSQMKKVTYKVGVSILPVCLIEFALILMTVVCVSLILLPYMIWLFACAFPHLAPILFGKLRVIVNSQTGTYGFWASWYQKEELNHFQKTINKVIETNAISAGQMQQTQYTESPVIPSPVVSQQSSPAVPQQPVPMVPSTQFSMQEGVTLLKEYNQLLQQGIIDQAEFDRIKTEILTKKY